MNKSSPIYEAMNRVEPRPKFLIINFQLAPVIATNYYREGELQNSEIQSYKNLEVFGKFPIAIKKGLKIIGGIDYRQKSFNVDPSIGMVNQLGIYDDLRLKTVGAELIFKANLKNDKFLYGYMSGSMKSDRLNISNVGDQLNYAVTLLRGKRLNPNTDYGLGAGFAVTLGRPIVFPLVAYNHRFNANWFLSVIAPQRVKVRYTFSEQMFGHFLVQGGGGAFLLTEPNSTEAELQLVQSELMVSLSLEREIHDWLWIRVRTGHRIPLNFYVSEVGKFKTEDRIYDLKLNSGAFVMFTLFAVVPTNIMKAKGR